MLEHVHKHITVELQQNTKSDTIFIIAAILLNLITMAVNSGMANESITNNNMLIAMFLFVALLIMVNLVVIFGLIKGKQSRAKLINGLVSMYKDQEVSKYYDETLLKNYSTRYNLFIMVVIFTGIVGIIVPFLMR